MWWTLLTIGVYIGMVLWTVIAIAAIWRREDVFDTISYLQQRASPTIDTLLQSCRKRRRSLHPAVITHQCGRAVRHCGQSLYQRLRASRSTTPTTTTPPLRALPHPPVDLRITRRIVRPISASTSLSSTTPQVGIAPTSAPHHGYSYSVELQWKRAPSSSGVTDDNHMSWEVLVQSRALDGSGTAAPDIQPYSLSAKVDFSLSLPSSTSLICYDDATMCNDMIMNRTLNLCYNRQVLVFTRYVSVPCTVPLMVPNGKAHIQYH
jgi:hypothetical protein